MYRERNENTARSVPDLAVLILMAVGVWWVFWPGETVKIGKDAQPHEKPHAQIEPASMCKGQVLPKGVAQRDRDLMILTVIGEAEFEPRLGQVAVAHVILNRWRKNAYGWKSIADVVLARKQYEPWTVKKGILLKIRPYSKNYMTAASVVDDALSGRSVDPTHGAYYFLNVGVVKKRGMSKEWKKIISQPDCVDIGRHKFCPPG